MSACEILAPAGALEQLEAAVKAGADAVYLGYGSFNARRNAKNFTFDELKSAVEYCHARNVSVHAAVNTLASDSELPLVYNTLKELALVNVDAVIVQDIGIAKIIKESFPSLVMHASTQMTVHNASGARLLEELGFKRVVLSRELSLDEIKKITAETSLETEVFIHGALCMCISGGCYLSSVLGQRSGNRGLCAQPCRLDFKVDGRGYALSLKDMCHIEYLDKLIDAGVTSFKIEGRMKRPEYVYGAVRAVRDKLENRKPDIEGLKKLFSRSGFTDGYMTGKRTLDMFGVRTKEDVMNLSEALSDFKMEENKRVSLNIWAKINAEGIKITAFDGKNTVTVSGEAPERSVNRPTEKADVIKQLSKVGGTEYYIESLEVTLEDGLFVPVSTLNSLRRDALGQLTQARIKRDTPQIMPIKAEDTDNTFNEESLIRVMKKEQLSYLEKANVIIPLEEIDGEMLEKHNVIGELPSLIFPFDEAKTVALIKEKQVLGLKKLYVDNLGALQLARESGLEFIAGWGLNILNSQSAYVVKKLGAKMLIASFESSIKNIARLKRHIPVGVLSYGYLPLMRMRACPLQKKEGCKGCTGIGKMTDRMNVEFTLLCNKKRYTTMLNSLPLYSGDRDTGGDFNLLYFNLETPERVSEIYNNFGSAPWFERTNGLYLKTLK